MADLTVTTNEAILFANARQIMKTAGRLLPFPCGHLLRKIDAKLAPDIQQWYTTLTEERDALAERDGEGVIQRHPNGNQVLTPESEKALAVKLAPVLLATITLTDVAKIQASAFGTVELSDTEMEGLAPFIAD